MPSALPTGRAVVTPVTDAPAVTPPPVPLLGQQVNTQQLYYNIAPRPDPNDVNYRVAVTRPSALPPPGPGRTQISGPTTTVFGKNQAQAKMKANMAWGGMGIPGLKMQPATTAYRKAGWAQEQGIAPTIVATGEQSLVDPIGRSRVRSGVAEAMPAPPPPPTPPPIKVTGLPGGIQQGGGAQHRAKGGPILPLGDKNLKKVASPLAKIKKPMKTKSFKKPKQPKQLIAHFAEGGAVHRFLTKYPNYSPMD